jgi:hypothetical protein
VTEPCEQELSEWCEALIRYMRRTSTDKAVFYANGLSSPTTIYEQFMEDYPETASEMIDWFEQRQRYTPDD